MTEWIKLTINFYSHLTVSSVASRTQVKGMIIPVGIKQSTVNVEGIKWCPHNSPDEGGIFLTNCLYTKRINNPKATFLYSDAIHKNDYNVWPETE